MVELEWVLRPLGASVGIALRSDWHGTPARKYIDPREDSKSGSDPTSCCLHGRTSPLGPIFTTTPPRICSRENCQLTSDPEIPTRTLNDTCAPFRFSENTILVQDRVRWHPVTRTISSMRSIPSPSDWMKVNQRSICFNIHFPNSP